MRTLIKTLFVLFLFCSSAQADTVYISDQGGSHVGYCHDNGLVAGGLANANYGGNNLLAAGDVSGLDEHTIIRWDTSQIPEGSDVTAVDIVFEVDAVYSGGVTITAYELDLDNYGWTEGTETGGTQAGSSCWNDHTYQNQVEWAGGAGCDVAGTDYINTSLGTCDMTSTGTKTLSLNASGVQAVEDSITGGTFEMITIPDTYDTGVRSVWRSSEYATAGDRPYMQVTYTEAAGGSQVIGHGFQFSEGW